MAPAVPPSSAKRKAASLKQGSLFSFFSKKPAAPNKAAPPEAAPVTAKPTPTPTKAAAAVVTQATPSVAATPVAAAPPPPAVVVGTTLQVYWEDDDTWYDATVRQIDNTRKSSRVRLEYAADDTTEWIDLRSERYRLATPSLSNKKRRILADESSDEEMEFDDADDGDASDYEAPASDDDEDDGDTKDWIVSDDDEEPEADEAPPKKKKASPKTRPVVQAVTRLPALTSLTPSDKSKPASTLWTTPGHRPTVARVTPPAHTMASPQADDKGALAYTVGAVNPRGAHVHNHLRFLQPQTIKDAQGRSPAHADYDGRTLKVNLTDWKTHNNGKPMTDAVQQWWDLKAQYFDTVLLFKTGKFYEMFHMDADVGVEVMGLAYMKGHMAHAGFPEISYGTMADQLVRAGYKVARVEQTETVDQLAQRKKKHNKRSGKPTPKVVNREVCSILSLGTRTFCYLDDATALVAAEQPQPSLSSHTGPLLVIREVEFEAPVAAAESPDVDDDTPPAACEYGITLVDAIRGSVTLGQFADDVLRSRMQTLLASFAPSEIILQGGSDKASLTLESLISTFQRTSQHACRVEVLRTTETSPKSTALDPRVRQQLERPGRQSQPWDVTETVDELHRRQYYPKASKQKTNDQSTARWPPVLRAVMEGEANLALSSFGAALYYLQRSLIDAELLSLGIVKAYVPPSSTVVSTAADGQVESLAAEQSLTEAGVLESSPPPTDAQSTSGASMDWSATLSDKTVADVNHMALDGTTLHNLEILYNTADGKVAGSLWSKLNHTKTPHGSRLLRAWLLRPLFRKADIERRADAVEELVAGGAAVALNEARSILAKCGDIERLLSRVHSMSGSTGDEGGSAAGVHPSERAVLYEAATYTKRKVGDFSKVLTGLRQASQIPSVFHGLEINSGLLHKIAMSQEDGGRFPDITAELEWYFDNFDCEKAAKGFFEPNRGVDDLFDEALDAIERIEADLKDYQKEVCASLGPQARSTWKYVNTKPNSKDKYLIELPASVRVPQDFIVKGKRGSGGKQVNKYSTPVVEQLVQELEQALDTQSERKSRGMQLIFAKFDSMRHLWALVAQTTAMLDALGALAIASSKPGYSRPTMIDCPPDGNPSVSVSQGRHPCIETSMNAEFIPNDISLGTGAIPSRVLLLSGPNMGGKSTLLRQTCLISILAQIGCFVPAEDCHLTPIDRIFTRLGASDRILLGQSTFFVELAETAAALRGATSRSLVIMDELGRGTSTFDGTAIASATVKHLVERSQCLTLFATHYHSLLDEWKQHPMVRLGHMECMVSDEKDDEESTVTFLYTLGDGVCPKSFGINVARLAGLPEAVLSKAKQISSDFEEEVSSGGIRAKIAPSPATLKQRIDKAMSVNDWKALSALWQELRA